MKNCAHKIATSSTRAACFVLVTLFWFAPVEPSHAMVRACEQPYCSNQALEGGPLARTFTPQHHAKGNVAADFVFTRDDLLRLFAIGSKVAIVWSYPGEVYPLNIGSRDLETAQSWTLPAMPIDDPSIWTLIDASDTPHIGLFPGATHALVTTNDQFLEGTVYLYYEVGDFALYSRGEVIEPPGEAYVLYNTYDTTIAIFPLAETLVMNDELDVLYRGQDAILTRDIRMHGFGAWHVSPETTLEAGVFVNRVEFHSDQVQLNPEFLGSETYYSFVAADGTWLEFGIADAGGDGTEIPEGDVLIDDIAYVRIVDAGTTAFETETLPERPTWSAYPNPADDVIRFSASTSVSLYDVLGRLIRTGASVDHLDVSDLTPGPYLLRDEAGHSELVVIR